MRRHDGLLLTIALLAVAMMTAAEAQPADRKDGVYAPQAPLQSRPLRVEVIDGVRFRDIETDEVYRLYGIDTCAPGQTARLGRQPWRCGTMAISWLVTATLNAWLACNTLRKEASEHLVRCATAGHPDIAADMLRAGVAVALPGTEQDPPVRVYIRAEQDARKAFRGLWSSTFQMPWEWRANHPTALPLARSEATP
ncbi:MAG: nuclease [Stutzerimonas stutzeri]|nr:MAG: nuclease [Stutzerimonas stutzeri]